jgi:hypothetical protein
MKVERARMEVERGRMEVERGRMEVESGCATVLDEGNKVHTERLPSQVSASGSSY